MDDSQPGPVKRAIDACGGAEAVGSRFDISRVSVYEWIEKGRIPADKAPIVAEWAAEKGVLIPMADLCPPVPWAVAHAHMNAVEAADGG